MLDLAYNLESNCPIPWNANQESNLHSDYPLSIDNDELENPQGYVIRRYLETVWLPESISSLGHLITSLQRVQPSPLPTTITQIPTTIHPLHEYLDTLLLTVKSCSEKYRTELPQIIANGGGAGEQEESMMWFVWNYGLEPDDVDIDVGGSSSQMKDTNNNKDDIWKAKWLEKLERRETMIQILLFLLKLSLPGPCPLPAFASSPTQNSQTQNSPSKKRKRTHRDQDQTKSSVEILEEQLELYMDKLSTWQLMDSINPPHARDLSFKDIAIPSDLHANGKGKGKEEKHWAVAFCEEIVEDFFKDTLPTYCTLLRSKLIPESTTEDDSDDDLPSPTSIRNPKRTNSTISEKSQSRTRSNSRAPTIESETSRSRSHSSKAPTRSRSLSVSLAEDEDKQRRALVGPKRMLSREISMSRTFKEKVKLKKSDPQELISQPVPLKKSTIIPLPPRTNLGKTLIEDTPIRRHSGSGSGSTSATEHIPRREISIPTSIPLFLPDSDDNIIIEDTPTRPQRTHAQASRSSQNQNTKSISSADLEWEDDDDDDEFTDSFGSPDILMLGDIDVNDEHGGRPGSLGNFFLDMPTRSWK